MLFRTSVLCEITILRDIANAAIPKTMPAVGIYDLLESHVTPTRNARPLFPLMPAPTFWSTSNDGSDMTLSVQMICVFR